MNIGQAGLTLIKSFETCSLTRYDDGYGFDTIGWGHLCGKNMWGVDCITQEKANALLVEDLAIAETVVNSSVVTDLTQNQFDALVSFVFNVGGGRAAKPGDIGKDGFARLKSGNPSTMLRKLNAGDFEGAVGQFTLWSRAGGVVSRGLVRRRAAERELFLKP